MAQLDLTKIALLEDERIENWNVVNVNVGLSDLRLLA